MTWAVGQLVTDESWLKTVYGDKSISPRARQVAGIIGTRFANNGRTYFHDVDCTAFLDLSSSEVGELRRELIDAGYLRPFPNNGASKPKYRLTYGTRRAM